MGSSCLCWVRERSKERKSRDVARIKCRNYSTCLSRLSTFLFKFRWKWTSISLWVTLSPSHTSWTMPRWIYAHDDSKMEEKSIPMYICQTEVCNSESYAGFSPVSLRKFHGQGRSEHPSPQWKISAPCVVRLPGVVPPSLEVVGSPLLQKKHVFDEFVEVRQPLAGTPLGNSSRFWSRAQTDDSSVDILPLSSFMRMVL